MPTWQGRTSLHRVLPVWHDLHALRTDGALAIKQMSAVEIVND